MDFTLNKANMKRKQSSSLLAALGKPGQRVSPGGGHPPSSYAPPAASYAPSIASSSEDSHDTGTYYAESSRGARSVSASTTTTASSIYGRGNAGSTPRSIRRVDDVFLLVRERLIGWSYLMHWYNGDVPWLNSINVSRAALESSIGLKAIDTQARQEYALGLSLAALFDITGIADFLRAVLRLMDEWEAWAEQGGSKGVVRNFFRPKRVVPRPSAARDTATAEVTIAPVDATSESFLVLAVMPFTPDWFQVYASTCSIVRDVYKKILTMVLPVARGRPEYNLDTLLHPSTFVMLAAVDGSGAPLEVASDASLVTGELPQGRTPVGEGQKLTPAVIDLLLKVDSRLKKHYAGLIRDGDTVIKKVLDDEIAAVTASIAGGPALRVDPPNAQQIVA